MGRRARVHRPEDFGRYDPINHALYIDREPHVAPGIPSQPITLKVGAKGRLNAVLESRDAEILSMAVEKGGVPMEEPLTRHDRTRKMVPRPEDFGRYDPLSSTLVFSTADGSQHNVRVGDNGRLRSVLESGVIDGREAQQFGLPPPETYKGKAPRLLEMDPGSFNPLPHQLVSPRASPRDKPVKGDGARRAVRLASASLSPRRNPLNHRLEPLNHPLGMGRQPHSSRTSPVLSIELSNFQIVQRLPVPVALPQECR